jgi:hypothetical protein
MRHPAKPVFYIMLFMVFLPACKEIFYPKVEDAGGVLVVEALLTDIVETYHVKLSSSIPYNSSVANIPVTGAVVFVQDHTDNRILRFAEMSNGYYEYSPDSGVVGVTGHTYTLYIETPEGDKYESFPETMHRTSAIDSVYCRMEDRTILTDSDDGSSQYKTQTYLNIVADVRDTGTVSPRFRFKTDWLYEMIDKHEGCMFNCPPPWYIWHYSREGPQSLTEPTDNMVLKEQLAGTALIDYFQMLYDEQHLAYLVLILNSYQLNNDSYAFYNDIKDQLSADNALFDPITTQITGNIRCLTDPDKPVIGLFEVSIHETNAYMIIPKQLSIKKVRNFNGLPAELEGLTEGTPPYWWIMQ